jgi:uncharacterized protein (DUF1778 family)
MAVTATKTCRLNLRATKDERKLIMRAAAAQGQKMASFVIESAYEKAEQVLADQRNFELSPSKWNAFVEALDRPVKEHARLVRLMSEPSILER